jgi:hypothetical protein
MTLSNTSNLFYDHFIYGWRTPKSFFGKSKTVNDWFKHTEKPMERDFNPVYYNIGWVDFCNYIDFNTVKALISDNWELYFKHYPFSTKEDYITDFWGYTIYELEIFLKEEIYFHGWCLDGFELFFCSDPNDITNNLWFFIPEDRDISFFKHYYKAFLKELNEFKDLKVVSNSKLLEKEISMIQYLTDKGFKWVHIYRFLKDTKQFIDISEKDFINSINIDFNAGWDITKRFSALKDIQIPNGINGFYEEKLKELGV